MTNRVLACLAVSVACIVGCEQSPDPGCRPGAVELAPAAADAAAVQAVVQRITKLGANVGRERRPHRGRQLDVLPGHRRRFEGDFPLG